MVIISIIIYKDTFGSAIFPTIDLINNVNDSILKSTGKPFFHLKIVGYKQKSIAINDYTTIKCNETIPNTSPNHIILLPSVEESFLEVMNLTYYDDLSFWLQEEYKKGVKLCSMCLGSILLAHTGLLNQLPCTTHWMGDRIMRIRFPEVIMQPSKMVTKKKDIYTSGGAFSSLQLIFVLIEEYCSKELAHHFSKILGIEYPLKSQNRFYLFSQQKEHEDTDIKKIQLFMEKNYIHKISIPHLALKANMSPRNFIRRFKKATGNTPIAYLQKIRIEVAKKEFEAGNLVISDVMRLSGYKDIKSFRVLFKRIAGLSPSIYSKRQQTSDNPTF